MHRFGHFRYMLGVITNTATHPPSILPVENTIVRGQKSGRREKEGKIRRESGGGRQRRTNSKQRLVGVCTRCRVNPRGLDVFRRRVTLSRRNQKVVTNRFVRSGWDRLRNSKATERRRRDRLDGRDCVVYVTEEKVILL